MTAIVGIRQDGRVWIGGDAAGVGGLSMSTRADPKVFRNGEFVIGYTSSFRMGQLLEHQLTPPKPYEGEAGVAFMVRRFVPAVKKTLKEHGYERRHEEQEYGGHFLVGWRGELYHVEGDYQVAREAQGYAACGCGCDLALGSLFSTERLGTSKPKPRLLMALEAAAEFSAGVRPPFTILATEKGKQ